LASPDSINRNVPHGPIANRLWRFVGEQAARLNAAVN
jgi:hypothetical protein